MCARLCAVCYGLSTFVAQRVTTSQPNVGVWTEVRCDASETSKGVCVPRQHPAAKRPIKADFKGILTVLCCADVFYRRAMPTYSPVKVWN